jgi:Glycosyltransferase 61
MRETLALLLILRTLHLTNCLRGSIGNEFIPDYRQYYYTDLPEKFAEVMSLNNCTTSGEHTGFEASKGTAADLHISIVPPPTYVTRRWGTEGHESFNVSRVYMRLTGNLCKAKKFIKFKQGEYKHAKGCMELYETEKHTGETKKRIIRYGATVHPVHVRCENKIVAKTCAAAGVGNVELPKEFRMLHQYPFLITAKRAVVVKSGMLALPCGPVGLLASCEAVMWGLSTTTKFLNYSVPCRRAAAAAVSRTEEGAVVSEDCPFPRYKRVFAMAQYDDGQIGQFIQESLPKLVYHLDFLRANPDVKIQFGFSKKPSVPVFVLPHLYFKWLGLSDRLINGTYYADEVIMPREGGCQDPGYNAWEFLTMREKLFRLAGVNPDDHSRKRSIIVITRSGSRFTNNRSDYARRWGPDALQRLLKSLNETFFNHRVDIFSDRDIDLMRCIDCHIRLFADADILISFHGAGMMNSVYMRPGGVIIEVLPYFDSRYAPMVGIFPRVSGILGLHHYSYYVGDQPIKKTITGLFHHRVVMLDAVRLVNDTFLYAKSLGLRV